MKKVSNIAGHVMQHLSFAGAVVLIMLTIQSSFARITVLDESAYYPLYDSSQSQSYEDSKLFQNLLKKEATHLIKYGAIRSQMETDGKFDPDKVIDITAYLYRYSGIPEEYITANYRLGDLLRWGQNGIQYKTYEYMSGEEVDQFLNRTRTVTKVSSKMSGSNTISYFNSDLSSSTSVVDVSGNSIYGEDMTREDVYDRKVLMNRYQTVDGKNLEDHVCTWSEYDELCDHLGEAIEDLCANYQFYQQYQEYYDADGAMPNSNLVYAIRKVIGNKAEIYTNLSTEQSRFSELKNEVMKTCVRYTYYSPQTMEYETDTMLTENFLQETVHAFGYAYPDNVQIILGVSQNADIQDSFTQGRDAYCNVVSFLPEYFCGAIFCAMLFFVLLILVTVKEGNDGVLHAEDKIKTELMLGLGGLTGVVFGMGIVALVKDRALVQDFVSQIHFSGRILIMGMMSILFSVVLSFFYYSVVRRIKAKTMWKNSLLYGLCRWISRCWMEMSAHKSLLVRVIIPVGCFTVANLLAFLPVNWLYRKVAPVVGIMFAILCIALDILVLRLIYRYTRERQEILHVLHKICNGDLNVKVMEEKLYGENRALAEAVNCIGESVRISVETSMKDERLKADLITNVSHDIKTPLTSIINYVDLIKRENIADPKVQEYIQILDTKSQRLKQLTDDLVEASKISSGNIVLHMERINLVELLYQTIGEFSEKFEKKDLQTVFHTFQPSVYIEADSRRIWRVIENLFHNISKYALEGTRVYLDLSSQMVDAEERVVLSIKNISASELNVSPNELTERFIRGDESRTTEGSGLGLSIAKNLTEAMNGIFEISIDGDLFKVMIVFPRILEEK